MNFVSEMSEDRQTLKIHSTDPMPDEWDNGIEVVPAGERSQTRAVEVITAIILIIGGLAIFASSTGTLLVMAVVQFAAALALIVFR